MKWFVGMAMLLNFFFVLNFMGVSRHKAMNRFSPNFQGYVSTKGNPELIKRPGRDACLYTGDILVEGAASYHIWL